jgi:hypothetical protein
MSIKELDALAAENHLELKPTWNRSQRAFAIKKYLMKDKARQAGAEVNKIDQSAPALQQDLGQRPANPALEEALIKEEPKIDGRGGPRPGAGRPEGLSNEACKVKNLPTQPNETIVAAVKAIGALWSRKTNVKEVEFTDQECRELALPITQLLQYYYPGGIPEIAWVWASAGFSFVNIVNSRLRIIDAAKAAKAKGSDAASVNNTMPGNVGIGQNQEVSKLN